MTTETNDTKDKLEWFKNIQKAREYSSEQFDKAIVYMAGGGLVLTIGFVEKIISITKCTNTFLLMLSWIMFSVCLLVNLLSHLTSIKTMDFQLDHKEQWSKVFNVTTMVLNIVSILTIITGIVLFIVFINLNLSHG